MFGTTKKKIQVEMALPLVSIIIPVFNGENYLEEAILSALGQTYERIEVIVVNDGSTDQTSAVVKEYSDKIRYFEKNNGGVASALNYAIGKAEGSYISWLSHDDLYHQDKVKRQVESIFELPSDDWDKTIVWSNFNLVDEKGSLLRELRFEMGHPLNKLEHSLYPIVKGLIHGCSLLMPSKILRDPNHNFNESLKVTQDYDLWFRMFPKVRLVYLSEQLVFSRDHSEQGSKTSGDMSYEASSLWLGMVTNMSDEDKMFCDGTVKAFHQNTYKILTNPKYKAVARHLEKLIANDSENRVLSSDIKISVIIPFHIVNDELIEAIECVENQSHKNVEIILVDDSGKDIPMLLRDKLKRNQHIKIVVNKFGQGAGGSRNTGINNATGEYIAFLDSDDLFDGNKLEIQLNFMLVNDILASHTSYQRFGDTTLFGDKVHIDSGSKSFAALDELLSNCVIATPTFMVQRALLGQSIRYRNDFKVAEDLCFYLDVLNQTNIRGLNETLSRVRISQSTTAFDRDKQFLGQSNIIQHCLETYFQDSSSSLFRSEKLKKSLLKLNTHRHNFCQNQKAFESVYDTEMELKYSYDVLQVGDGDVYKGYHSSASLKLELNKLNLPTAHLVKNRKTGDSTFSLSDGFMVDENAPSVLKKIRERLDLECVFNPAFYDLLFNPVFLNSQLTHFHQVHNDIIDMHLLPTVSKLKPLVWTFHDSWPISGQYESVPSVKSNNCLLNDRIKQDAFERSDFKIIVSSSWMKNIVEQSPGFRNKDVRIVPLTIDESMSNDIDKNGARIALGIANEDIVVMFRCDYSNTDEMDYIEYFLTNYFPLVPITILHVGEEPSTLLNAALSKFNVKYYPTLKDHELMSVVMTAADIFLTPSGSDSFELMAVESMLNDTLPIVVDGTSMNEVVGAPKCGVSTPENNLEYFFCVKEFIENNPVRESRIRECKSFAKKKYTSRSYVSEIQSVYQSALMDHELTRDDSLLLEQLKKRNFNFCT